MHVCAPSTTSYACKLLSRFTHTMELYYNSSMLVSLLPTILLCILTAFILMRKLSSQKSKFPPGPRGLPIIGHLHLLGKLPHQSLFELSRLHGPLMSLRFGSVPVVVASSPEMARQILQTHDVAFSDRMPTAAANHIFGGCTDIALSPPNAHWKLMRRLCAIELFSTKGLQSSKPVRVEEIQLLMRSVLADSMDTANTTKRDATLQQLRHKLQGTFNDMIMRVLFGKRFSELSGKQDVEGSHKPSIVDLAEEIFELTGMFNVGDFLPFIAWMDLQGCERRSKKLAAKLRAAFEGIIRARRLASEEGRPPNDYLDVLLKASASSDIPIHVMEVITELMTAGTDTSALSIEWALAELLSNPEKMRIAQGEIDQVVGRTRMIREEDIEHLPFLGACVKETMRLHPVAPLLVPHMSNQACEILGFHIPSKTQAYVNMWAIARDPKVWNNPTMFSPERFLHPSSTMDVQGQHFELLPFGSGRRICPGWRLGLINVHIVLGSLLQGFDWTIPPSHHLDMSEYFYLNLCLSTPLVACATARLPKALY